MSFQGGMDAAATGEETLMRRIREGDPNAWRAVSDAFRHRLRQLATGALPVEISSRLDASDMVQQSFTEACGSINDFVGKSMPELYVWLAAILQHNVGDAVRKHLITQRRSVRKESCVATSGTFTSWDHLCKADQTSPSMAVAREETHQRLRDAIRSLPIRQRDAVQLRHFERLSLSEIAAHLNCTEKAAAAVIARGLARLRERLGSI